jgi:hypothetical protein
MSVDRRRAGFRLPWTTEGGETDDEHAASDAKADDVPKQDDSAMPAADAPATDPPAADASSTEVSATDASAADTSAVDVTAADAPADGTASTADPEGDSTGFLRSLVAAMRGVAETSRDASLAELRTAIDARLEALSIQAAEMESDLRRGAELDLATVADWERTEIERIRTEAEHKREARRTKLEQQLSEHRTSSERDAEATRNRLAEHEEDLAAFFAQLGEITDPAAFVAAAKRMPRAPELTGLSSAATPAAVATPVGEDPRLAAMGMSPADATPPAPEPTAETTTTAVAHEAPAEASPPEASSAEDGPAAATDSSASDAPASAGDPPASPDNRLAERLAQLDERLSGATAVSAAAPTPANGNGGEGSTAIIVKGLGSFGAITSFKQALERVEGVRGVTLSLGPTGEFVYRASHGDAFDLVAAIQSIEGPTASIDNTDGTLVVTLSRAR